MIDRSVAVDSGNRGSFFKARFIFNKDGFTNIFFLNQI